MPSKMSVFFNAAPRFISRPDDLMVTATVCSNRYIGSDENLEMFYNLCVLERNTDLLY